MPDGAYISAVMFLFLRLVLKVKNSLGLVGDVTLHAVLEYAKIVSQEKVQYSHIYRFGCGSPLFSTVQACPEVL